MTVLPIAATLAGCATAPGTPATSVSPLPSTYAFAGPEEDGELGWRGVIFGDRMIYRDPGNRGWRQTDVAREVRDGGERITADGVTVTIEPGRCARSGTMRDRVVFASVYERHEGCGGPLVVADSVDGTTWTLRELDGRRVPDGPYPAATVTFAKDGPFFGTSACNGAGGGVFWRPDGRFIRTGITPTIMTLAGCVHRASVEFGGRFWERMDQARRWTRDGRKLTITFADGGSAGLALIM